MNIANISGKTKIAGIVGNPVEHSLSPKIHNFLFEKFKIDAVYVPFRIENEHDLESFVKTFRSANFLGCNVTIPYKSAIIPFIDEIDMDSQNTQTANTLYSKDGKICADTTDFWGFNQALKNDNFDINKKNVVILGNGGVARTIAMILPFKREHRDILPETLSLVGRNIQKLNELANDVTQKTNYHVSCFTFENAKDTLWNADIIINCTSVGMYPNIENSPIRACALNPKTYIFDTIYNPFETKFMLDAQKNGNRTQNGLRMLIWQAIASFYFWTKIDLTDDNTIELELENLLLKELKK
jgi:shikimate dehydrogenase